MKIRFWQKTFLQTLLIFLICLYACIFSLAWFTFNRTIDQAYDSCKAEYFYIVKSYEDDYLYQSASPGSDLMLMNYYGSTYSKQQTYLWFLSKNETVYSSLPESIALPPLDSITQTRMEGQRYILIASEVCDGEYLLVYAKNAHSIDQAFRSLLLIYTGVALCISLVLIAFLLPTLRKLSTPLERLTATTEQLANGNMDIRAEVVGNDEFTVLASSFNHMVETLAEDSKRKQMLVDNMAHELRTPLTSIRGYAQYVEMAAISEEERIESLERIISETDRLQKISDKVLDTAFIRANAPTLSPVCLPTILSDVVDKLHFVASEKSITIQLDSKDGIVYGDDVLLSMLFYNLTENALKASPKDSVIHLSCVGTKVTITDHGKGMTPEELSRITEPFYRTDKNRSRAQGGAGLGLALCKQIVIAHNAELSFDSEINVGTQVTVTFPERGTHEET